MLQKSPSSYQAYATSLLVALSVLFASCDTSNSSTTPKMENLSFSLEVFEEINTYRVSQSLAPLSWDSTIAQVAFTHSENMATGTVPFGHEGFNDRYAELTALIGITAIAENVALGQQTAKQVVEGWINSDGHRKNIEGNYTKSGIGIVYKGSSPYYTQIFTN